ADQGADAILVMNCPVAVADSLEAAHAGVDVVDSRQHAPVLTCWLGEGTATAARRLFASRRIPSYDTPEQAIQAFRHLGRYRRNQQLLMETPPDVSDLISIDSNKADAVIDKVLADGRTVLTEPEAVAVL